MKISIKDVFSKVRPFLILYLILLIAGFVIFLLYTKKEIYFKINAWNSPWGDGVAPYITDLGNGWTTVALSAILLLFNYRKAFLLATSYAITSLTAQLIKHIVRSDRPKLFFKDLVAQIHFVKGLYIDMHDSFPSGHTVTAFSTALLITYFCKNKNWGILLCAIAAMVGYSRMYLSEHFFEDVTAGSVLGVFLTVFWISFIDGKEFLHTAGWNNGLLFKKSSPQS